MPFVAHTSTHQRIDITDYATPKLQLNDVQLQCPYCNSLFTIVAGQKVIPHFRHQARCGDSVAQAYFSGETEEHRRAKRFLKNLFIHHLSSYTRTAPELEVRDYASNRIADLMISYPFGYRQAIEAQLSRVDVQNIIDRTSAYFNHGIDVFWFLGDNCRDVRVMDYLKRQVGFYHFIDCDAESFIIRAAFHSFEDGVFRSYSYEQGRDYWTLWPHLIRLAVIRYFQVYRHGFSPDFAAAIAGTRRAETLFGSNMKMLKDHGAVGGEKYSVAASRWPITLWKIISPENAAQWAISRGLRPMPRPAIETIKARSKHRPNIPGYSLQISNSRS